MHSPPFSKEAVRRSEHLITDMLAKFLDLLSGYVSGARPVDLTMGVRCLTADISMNYAFQRPFNALDEDGFQSQVIMGTDASSRLFQWLAYFPGFVGGVFRVAENLPEWLIRRYMRPFALVNWCLEVSAIRPVYAGCPTLGLMMARTGMSRPNRILTKPFSFGKHDTYGIRHQSQPQPRERTIHAYD